MLRSPTSVSRSTYLSIREASSGKSRDDRTAGYRVACRNPEWSLSLLRRAVAADQVIGRTVVRELRFALALQFGNDALRQHFAQFDAPLVEGIDVPDHALG